jgi:S1-C subfamily serine protease
MKKTIFGIMAINLLCLSVAVIYTQEWMESRFETIIPPEEIMSAFNSTYRVISKPYYRNTDGEVIDSPFYSTGSGILLNGGYVLTVKHVAHEEHPGTRHPFFSQAIYIYTKFFITDEHTFKKTFDELKKYELEKIFISEDIDYTLLKLKNENSNIDLPFYHYGLNFLDKVEVGMKSVAVGFPTDMGRNIRIGNVSQIESDLGADYITFKNSLIRGDSGGSLFIFRKNRLRYTAIAQSVSTIPDRNPQAPVTHLVNISYGRKVSSIIKDLKKNLKSGKLDKNVAGEIKKFLELNAGF